MDGLHHSNNFLKQEYLSMRDDYESDYIPDSRLRS